MEHIEVKLREYLNKCVDIYKSYPLLSIVIGSFFIIMLSFLLGWSAISAMGTVGAVIVALYIPSKDKKPKISVYGYFTDSYPEKSSVELILKAYVTVTNISEVTVALNDVPTIMNPNIFDSEAHPVVNSHNLVDEDRESSNLFINPKEIKVYSLIFYKESWNGSLDDKLQLEDKLKSIEYDKLQLKYIIKTHNAQKNIENKLEYQKTEGLD